MAEGILRDKLRKHNIPAFVDSCGFESFHVGDFPDSRAQEVARKRGIDLSFHKARLFVPRDFDLFDMIYAMDSSHFNKIIKLARTASDRAKVDYVLNLNFPGQNLSVPDPWYHDVNAFEEVFMQLDEACNRMVDIIAAGNPVP
jgi:protein-tyrosine phosphatase